MPIPVVQGGNKRLNGAWVVDLLQGAGRIATDFGVGVGQIVEKGVKIFAHCACSLRLIATPELPPFFLLLRRHRFLRFDFITFERFDGGQRLCRADM